MDASLKSRIAKNSAWAIVSSIVGRLGSLIFTIILARFLLPERYGVYSIAFSVAMIFITFADLGVDKTFIRYLSYSLSKEKNKVNAYYRYLLKVKMALALLASGALAVLSYPIAMTVFDNPQLFPPLLASAAYIFILAFEGFYSSIFYSLERIDCLIKKDFLSQSLRVIFALVLFMAVSSAYHLTGAFAVLALTSAIAIIVAYYYTKKLAPEIYTEKKEGIDKKRVIKFAGFLTLASISGIIFSYIDSVMLGLFVTPEYVGFYRAAFSLVFGVAGLIGFGVVLMPVFAKSEKNNLQRIFSGAFRYISILSAPLTFGIIALGRYFIRIFYGYEYIQAAVPIYFLAFSVLPIGVTGMIIALFSAEEKTKTYAKIFFITSMINLALNFILIKSLANISFLWATAGAGIATATSWIFYMIYSGYFARKEFGININYKILFKPVISGIVMVGAIKGFVMMFKDVNLAIGLFSVIIGAGVYFFCLWILKGICREDINVLRNAVYRAD